ncbi:YcjX family GTP-binding protein [Rhodobium gokarnense]|uniref:YcjX family protein n=1 Tax=Rhodobium gokarnense TaxID=364296 RepID=UPI002224273B|nr:YcjX family protein [Rhodobium gokarnense]
MGRGENALNLTTLTDDAWLALNNVADFATGLVTPSVRLGVTGLSRAGKTVFITALVHNLIKGGRMPLFEPMATGRLARASLQPQPDDAVPRFDYEAHVADMVDERVWPSSTRRISELRLTVAYESASYFSRTLGSGKLHIDIVDYPGEWLLDLPLLTKDYATWSREAVALSRLPNRARLAGDWHRRLEAADPAAEEDEATARGLADAFTGYLAACRADEHALSMLPPGRFLMPGDLDGSPALTFSPLVLEDDRVVPRTSMRAMMERRFEAYKTHVVRPFFRDHFARLDRQIVLVDALSALNAGPHAMRDLENALADILSCFRPGRTSWLASILTRRIDRILFAATKADHLHHTDHDRLQRVLKRLVKRAIKKAEFAGADIDILALAAVRATREGTVRRGGNALPTIIGTPMTGEIVDGERFDGKTEIAMFPGDLPKDPESLFAHLESESELEEAVAKVESESKHQPLQPESKLELSRAGTDVRYVRFRPPKLERSPDGLSLTLPHIRLDRALQFLIGDKLA